MHRVAPMHTPFDRHPVKDSGEYPTVGRDPNGTDLDGRPAWAHAEIQLRAFNCNNFNIRY